MGSEKTLWDNTSLLPVDCWQESSLRFQISIGHLLCNILIEEWGVPRQLSLAIYQPLPRTSDQACLDVFGDRRLGFSDGHF